MEYDLEMDKVVKEIKKQKASLVCLQLPDGMKPMAGKITEEIKSRTSAEVIVWLGSCFGACDIPLQAEQLGVDLLVQFGHSKWKK